MTEGITARVKRYRYRAEELRTMAEDWRHPETKSKIAEMASDYDQMADDLENKDRQHP